jgi:hypothetical protein
MNRSERAQPESSGGHLQELSRTRPILHVNSATAHTWVAIKGKLQSRPNGPRPMIWTKSIFSCNHHVAVRREIFSEASIVHPHCCNGALQKIQRRSQFKNSENATSLCSQTRWLSHQRKVKNPNGYMGAPFQERSLSESPRRHFGTTTAAEPFSEIVPTG